MEEIAPLTARAAAAAGLGWTDLSRIGVVRGPGSFVGVRVGVAAARGLALATGVEAVGIDGFEAAAETARRAGRREARAAIVFGSGDRLIWRIFALDGSEAAPLGAVERGDRAALAALGVAARLGPGADPDWPGADPRALLDLTFAAPPATEPLRPLYARAPDATASSRLPAPRL